MQFSLTFDMDNAAFQEAGPAEVQTILEKVASTIGDTYAVNPGDGGFVKDSNGNRVGEWEVTE